MKFLKLIRVEQYTKNLFVLMPLFFAGLLFDMHALQKAFVAFVAFSLMASVVYILNDIVDKEKDSHHPQKKYRPIASGQIKIPMALGIAIVFFIVSLVLAYSLNYYVLGGLVLYFVLNIFYSFWLKNIPIIDVSMVASFFLIRVFVGGFALDIVVSKWLSLMVFLLALGLVLGKRYDDVLISLKNKDLVLRESLKGYTKEYTQMAILSVWVMAVICYIMYTLSPEIEARLQSQFVYLTVIPVIIGMLKYLNIMMVDEQSGSPTKILLNNRFIQIVLLVWFALNLYFYYK